MENKNNLKDVFSNEMVALLPRLWRFAVSLTRHKSAAEDLVQQTCERALERRYQFIAGTRQDHWMFAIMSSLWKNHIRAERYRLGGGVIDSDELSDDSFLQQAQASLLRSDLHKAVLELPLWQRETVLLVYIEDLSYKEAAAVLKLPLGTVMSRLAAAKIALALKLNPNDKNIQNRRSYHGQ